MPKPIVNTEYVVLDAKALRSWGVQERYWNLEVAKAWALHYTRITGKQHRVHSVKITMELGPAIEPPAQKRKVKRG